jgi:ketosteroid isomerase-like protein
LRQGRDAGNSESDQYDSVELEDVKVTAFGDTAIATGGFKAKGTDASGKPLDVNERWTDTWMKMPGGKWQCIASHVSSLKM